MEIRPESDVARISGGLVTATVVNVEDVVNQYGESILFTFNVADSDGMTMEGMRIYCATPSLVPLSKLGKLVRTLVPKVTQKSINGIKDTQTLRKVAMGRKSTLEAYENDDGYMRLRLVGGPSAVRGK